MFDTGLAAALGAIAPHAAPTAAAAAVAAAHAMAPCHDIGYADARLMLYALADAEARASAAPCCCRYAAADADASGIMLAVVFMPLFSLSLFAFITPLLFSRRQMLLPFSMLQQ